MYTLRSLSSRRSSNVPLSRLKNIEQQFRPPSSARLSYNNNNNRLRFGSTSTSTMVPVPKTMKGVWTEKTGGVEVLQYRTDLPVPTPKEGEVLVKNEAIGINFIDTYFRTGLYPSAMPQVLGREAAGTVVSPPHSTSASGSVPILAAGTRVVWMHTGSYAEYSAVPAENCMPLPDGVSFETAAAACLQGLTALTLIDEAHAVKEGDWVLVHAAAGGVGGWLCQLLHARGAHTIASASTPAKRQQALGYGAEVCVPYDEVLATVAEKTPGGEGVVAVFDGVGQATFDMDLQAVARKGTVASFGNASGAVEPLKIARLSEKNVKVCRPTLFNYIRTPEEKQKYSSELFRLLEQDKVRVEVHEVYPLSEVQRAHTDLEGRKTTGKLLLKP